MSLVRSAALRSGLARISAMRSLESGAARLSGVVALRLSGVVELRLSGAVALRLSGADAQAPSIDAIAPSIASEKDGLRMSRVALTRSMAPLYRSRSSLCKTRFRFDADGGRSRGTDPAGRRNAPLSGRRPKAEGPSTIFLRVLAPLCIPEFHAFPLLHRLRPAQRQTNEDLEHFDAGMGA